MGYALRIGLRYLRSKKRSTVSVITFIAVAGVALGVAALLAVLSITSGFQDEFRKKVLGVNAHVLVLKYGLDFDEYRDVIARAEKLRAVSGAAPFLINEMMLAKGDRLSGVLVKGIDPNRMRKVLDVPDQIVQGSADGLRREGAMPPTLPDDLTGKSPDDDWEWLEQLAKSDGGVPADGGLSKDDDALADRVVRTDGGTFLADAGVAAAVTSNEGTDDDAPLPLVDVPSAEEVEASLAEMNEAELELPEEAWEEQLLAEETLRQNETDADRRELPGIVVGATLAKNLGLGVGDRVKLISPLTGLDVSMWRPGTQAPRSRDFRVIGIFEAGFQEYDSRLVYTDLYEAQRFYDSGDTVTGVEIRLHDLEQARSVARRLERELGGGPFHTMDWAELNHNLFTALAIQKQMLSLVIATIIFVAAFNVIATLIIVVLEKKREIAILKAMGATDVSILGIFVVQGVVIGVLGTLIGLVLGGGVVAYLHAYEFPLDPKVYLIDHVPIHVSIWEFLITTGVALAICATATLIPSWWAARMLPADGVRYE